MKKLVVAIDGPAASGKSTTARILAERLGYIYVDTGAMYRAMTLKVLQHRLDLDDVAGITALALNTEIRLGREGTRLKILLDGADVTAAIRKPAVTNAVSAVSALPPVRELMVREQRRLGREGGVVLEGRDIGTVVFPDADVKIYMVADVSQRARRRKKDLQQQGIEIEVDQIRKEILDRDRKDSQRDHSPLKQASDAITIDTSELTIDQQVDQILHHIQNVLHMEA
ncbi:MAG TPA: (d)CMP kinase [Bacteroidota bacterium]|nr:(d)CMP kinase [Bacteroidota bacterium]